MKISDFGWSGIYSTEKRKTFCGTLDYVSPEIIKGHAYDHSVDVWSVGILCYELCVGSAPFAKQSTHETYESILKVIFCLTKHDIPFPEFLSEDLRKLLSQILTKDMSKRIALESILKNKWIKICTENSTKKWDQTITKK